MATPHFPEEVKRRVSAKKKSARDYQRVKDLAQYYDNYYGSLRNDKEIEKLRINYDLFNGRLDVKLYDSPISFMVGNEKVTLQQNEIDHFPMISQVANALYGESLARPFRPMAREMGTRAQNARKKKYAELTRDYLSQEVIAPINQRVSQMYMQEYGVEDPFALSPEDQQQAQAEIQQRTQAATPERILDFMQNDFQTPTQRRAQQLLDWMVKDSGIRELQNEGFKHAIITGKEIYFISDVNGNPKLELVNPLYFQWGGGRQGEEWIQKGDWAKQERWISFNEAVSRYGQHFKRNDWKKMEEFAEPIGGFSAGKIGNPLHDPVQRDAMFVLSEENGYTAEYFKDVNVRTKAGQNQFAQLYANLTSRYGRREGGFGGYGIRDAHIAYRDLRKLYRITRIVNGKEKKFWVDEAYTPQPQDIDVFEHWVPEIWECNILGSIEPIYANPRRLPNQYKSVFDPYSNDLPYIGKEYNTHMGNSRNVAPVDLGKPYQKQIDVLMAEIRHSMATDIGKVFVAVMNMKPDKWKWQDWFSMMKSGKTVVLQTDKHGSNNVDTQLIKSLDLSRTQEIVGKLSMLETMKNNLIQAMYFNPTRMGMGGQYATSNTVDTNRAASYNQTESLFDTHRQILEHSLNHLIDRGAHVLRDQPEKLDYILDDVARADLDLSEGLWHRASAIDVSLHPLDIKKVEELRNNILTLTQNGMSIEGIAELALAETTSDILDLFRKETKKMQQNQAAAQQAAMEKEQADRDLELKKQQTKLAHEAEQKERDRQVSIERTIQQSRQFQLQADVDGNNVADSIQKADKELAFKREQLEAETKLKDRELDIKEKEVAKK